MCFRGGRTGLTDANQLSNFDLIRIGAQDSNLSSGFKSRMAPAAAESSYLTLTSLKFKILPNLLSVKHTATVIFLHVGMQL
jgi:hypothetical protein